MPYYCPHCHRSYQRKMYYDHHIAVCEILCKSKKERTAEAEELADMPTVRDLYKVVMEMTVKYNRLEEKYQEMVKYINVKKKQINGVDALNTTYNNANDYDQWCSTIDVHRKHLNTLFKSDYATGVIQVLREWLLLEDEKRPLRAFKEKESVLYVFKEKKWMIMDDDTYIKLMYILDKKFMCEFGTWKQEHKDELYSDDFTETYAKNTKKMMVTREYMYSRIKKELYKHLAVNL